MIFGVTEIPQVEVHSVNLRKTTFCLHAKIGTKSQNIYKFLKGGKIAIFEKNYSLSGVL